MSSVKRSSLMVLGPSTLPTYIRPLLQSTLLSIIHLQYRLLKHALALFSAETSNTLCSPPSSESIPAHRNPGELYYCSSSSPNREIGITIGDLLYAIYERFRHLGVSIAELESLANKRRRFIQEAYDQRRRATLTPVATIDSSLSPSPVSIVTASLAPSISSAATSSS